MTTEEESEFEKFIELAIKGLKDFHEKDENAIKLGACLARSWILENAREHAQKWASKDYRYEFIKDLEEICK